MELSQPEGAHWHNRDTFMYWETKCGTFNFSFSDMKVALTSLSMSAFLQFRWQWCLFETLPTYKTVHWLPLRFSLFTFPISQRFNPPQTTERKKKNEKKNIKHIKIKPKNGAHEMFSIGWRTRLDFFRGSSRGRSHTRRTAGPTDPVAHFSARPGHTYPKPGVSQVESLRFRLSELRDSMEFSPSPLIVCTYQRLRGESRHGRKQ